jgi:hypothetical protein
MSNTINLKASQIILEGYILEKTEDGFSHKDTKAQIGKG